MIFQKCTQLLLATSKASDGNMDYRCGDQKEVSENRRRFLSSLEINLDSVITLRQQHGNQIISVGKTHAGCGGQSDDNALKGDGLITNKAGIYLIIKAADCHQIALFDPKNKAISLIHAGWKGLDLGIIKNAVKAMKNNFHANPKDLIVELGPSIGPCCYKNLPTLKQAQDLKWQPYIIKSKDGSFGVDIWEFAEDQLKDAGVLPGNIDNPRVCTYHNSEYFSYRRAVIGGEKDFEFITILGMR